MPEAGGLVHRHGDGQAHQVRAMGEKLTDLEVFHPERMASRILGMGDVLSLIEKAEEVMDQEKVKALDRG